MYPASNTEIPHRETSSRVHKLVETRWPRMKNANKVQTLGGHDEMSTKTQKKEREMENLPGHRYWIYPLYRRLRSCL
jgi:hypothetical protein